MGLTDEKTGNKGVGSERGGTNDDTTEVEIPGVDKSEGKTAENDLTGEDGVEKTAEDGQKNGEEDESAVLGESEDDYKHQPMFVCCCGASFQFLGQITSHKKKACQWIYVCPHCNRVYKDFDKMEVHKKSHNSTVKAQTRAQAIVAEPLKKDVGPTVEAKKTDSDIVAADSTKAAAVAEKKTEASSLGQQEPKSIPKVVERNLPKRTLIIRPPPIVRPKGPSFPHGNNLLGSRPNFMPNQGMMNPGFQGGFNQGIGMMNPQMGMMNPQMGMGPMNMGMGNFGPNMCAPNMMGGMNMSMNMPNMGMNMPNMGNYGHNTMGGMNMGMNNMNMGMNMGNFGPNMGGNFGPMGGPMGMNQGSNMGPKPGGHMGAGPNMPGQNMGGGPNMHGQNMGSKMGASKPFGPDVPTAKRETLPPPRGRELTPPGRRSPSRRSLSPPRRRDSRSPRLRRDSRSPPLRRDSCDEYARWRDITRGRSPSERDRDIDLFRRSDDRPDRPDRPSPWAQRSMTREQFLSTSSSLKERESPFSKSDPRDDPFAKDRRDNPFPKDYRDDPYSADRRDDPYSTDRGEDPFAKDRRDSRPSFSPRDDGPPGLGKYGISGGSYKRENTDPLSKHLAKMMKPF